MATLLSCGETEQIGNKLEADELAYLRARAAAKCISESNPEFRDIIEESNSNLVDYVRADASTGDAWKYIYKKSTSTTADATHYVYVWRQTTSYTIFRIVLDNAGSTQNIFLKYDSTINNDMFRTIQEDICAKTFTSGSTNSSSGTIKIDDPAFTVTGTGTSAKYKFFRTYSLSSAFPAFFTSLRLARIKKIYNDDDAQTSSETYNYTIEALGSPEQPDVYTDATIQSNNPTYCLATSAAPTGTNTYRDYTFPINVLAPVAAGSNLTCNTTGVAITDGAVTFTPTGVGSEL